MRLTLVTPLFPPDVHSVAAYHKDLVARLQRNHAVSVLLYGHLPEQVPGVSFTTIDKRTNVLTRLRKMLTNLFSSRSKTDYYLITNGPSTELPALLLSFFTRTPFILLLSDTLRREGISKQIYTTLHTVLKRRAKAVISVNNDIPKLIRPEIHPLIFISANARAEYETTWAKHLTNIDQYLS